MTDNIALNRFGLINGQFFAEYKYKNLWWRLDGTPIGFGDLREEDISKIKAALDEDEEFVGWNEHHGSLWQQTDTPMIRITKNSIVNRADIVVKEGR